MKDLSNKDHADRFIRVVAEDKTARKNFKSYLIRRFGYYTEAFNDNYQDAILKAYEAILKKGFTAVDDSAYRDYFYTTFRNEYVNTNIANQKKHKTHLDVSGSEESFLGYTYGEGEFTVMPKHHNQNDQLDQSKHQTHPAFIYIEEYGAASERELKEYIDKVKSHQIKNKYLDQLPPHLSSVFRLKYYNTSVDSNKKSRNMTYKEIAKKLEISFDIVRNRLYEARQLVNKMLEEDPAIKNIDSEWKKRM
ncbi:RNA polymerase sigma factor [Rufibacter ruber]|uniref:RNA polymerase sigma factor n=1 Tax=Rufibacter ruber TaxID=1783499 RepID=UPI000830463F|nr:sigma-70 family RNA polymerase sigma factor [Rufibacter ruber]